MPRFSFSRPVLSSAAPMLSIGTITMLKDRITDLEVRKAEIQAWANRSGSVPTGFGAWVYRKFSRIPMDPEERASTLVELEETIADLKARVRHAAEAPTVTTGRVSPVPPERHLPSSVEKKGAAALVAQALVVFERPQAARNFESDHRLHWFTTIFLNTPLFGRLFNRIARIIPDFKMGWVDGPGYPGVYLSGWVIWLPTRCLTQRNEEIQVPGCPEGMRAE